MKINRGEKKHQLLAYILFTWGKNIIAPDKCSPWKKRKFNSNLWSFSEKNSTFASFLVTWTWNQHKWMQRKNGRRNPRHFAAGVVFRQNRRKQVYYELVTLGGELIDVHLFDDVRSTTIRKSAMDLQMLSNFYHDRINFWKTYLEIFKNYIPSTV